MKRTVRVNGELLLFSLAVPLLVGGISALLTSDSMGQYAAMNQPTLAPPGWVFPIAWTLLYLMMGFASYLVLMTRGDGDRKRTAMFVYAAQLVLNFFWSILFFRFSLYFIAFLWLVVLWVVVLLCTGKFFRVSKRAGLLMIPYMLWLTFAAYLNFAVYQLNVI